MRAELVGWAKANISSTGSGFVDDVSVKPQDCLIALRCR